MASATEKQAGRARRAKRGDMKQAERTRKKEDARKENQVKNRERVRTGKAQKADPGTGFKPSIWEKMAEDRVYHKLREMGDTTRNIDKFQKKRVLMALFLALLAVPAGIFLHVYLYIAGPILGFTFYKMKAKSIDTYHRAWKFERQLNFSKFTRLVIPYLKASGGTAALYTIFNKILKRTENEADRRSLYQLMGEMGDNPADIQPFLDYAERSSGTDMSHLFMSTIFDFQQSTFDTQVIDELGKMAGEDMMNAIDEIINMKLRRFVMFPTKVVLSSFILVVGLGAGLMIDSFQNLDMGGVSINPSGQVEEAEEGAAATSVPDDDAAVVSDSETESAATDNEASGNWQEPLNAIAADTSLDNAAKWQEMSQLALAFKPGKADMTAFEANVKREYMTSMYTADLTNHAYTLANGFQSQVLKQQYDSDKDNPMYTLALVFWTNSYYTYVEDKKTDVTANETKANALLTAEQDVCKVKADSGSKQFYVMGGAAYDGAESDKTFCTVREALNAGYTAAK